MWASADLIRCFVRTASNTDSDDQDTERSEQSGNPFFFRSEDFRPHFQSFGSLQAAIPSTLRKSLHVFIWPLLLYRLTGSSEKLLLTCLGIVTASGPDKIGSDTLSTAGRRNKTSQRSGCSSPQETTRDCSSSGLPQPQRSGRLPKLC